MTRDDKLIEVAIQGHASTRDAIRYAIKCEREACARVCDDRAGGYKYETDIYAHEHISEAKHCATAIRARGEE